jgi:hypothetical protein
MIRPYRESDLEALVSLFTIRFTISQPASTTKVSARPSSLAFYCSWHRQFWATEFSHTSKVALLYPTADGNFAVGFTTNSSNCSNGSSPTKFHYIVVGQNSITADGAKKMYAALVLAMSIGLTVTISFDNGTASCYVNRLSVVPTP